MRPAPRSPLPPRREQPPHVGPSRRDALAAIGGGALALRWGRGRRQPSSERTCLLVLTADDMDYGSLGATGCPIEGLTPHLDALAARGRLLTEAHVTVSSCKPSRQSLLTGRVPHRYGSLAWGGIDADVPTLPELLGAAGYLCGILGKVDHHTPVAKLGWDLAIEKTGLGLGRDPGRFRDETELFLARASEEDRPFFLLVNSSDPHRPFPGTDDEEAKWSRAERRWRGENPDAAGPGPYVPPPTPRAFRPDEVPVPPFLPDLPGVRADLAGYFAAIHRLDATVGAVLGALEASGHAPHTLVTFLSDNGMALPFAKGNVYRHSTRTPWIVRWPGRVEGGGSDGALVSGVDLAPSLLEAAGLEAHGSLAGMDGVSWLPRLARGEPHPRRHLFTYHDDTAAELAFPMRAVSDGRFGYVLNLWADGDTTYANQSTNGPAFQALRDGARTDEGLAARLRAFRRRPVEELHDSASDPGSLVDLAGEPEHRRALERLRAVLLGEMERSEDPRLADAHLILAG